MGIELQVVLLLGQGGLVERLWRRVEQVHLEFGDWQEQWARRWRGAGLGNRMALAHDHRAQPAVADVEVALLGDQLGGAEGFGRRFQQVGLELRLGQEQRLGRVISVSCTGRARWASIKARPWRRR
jgi:hypothetical protein